MTRQDLIQEFTEDYTDALQEAVKAGQTCGAYDLWDMSQEWSIKPPYDKHLALADMDSEDLATVCCMVEQMLWKLKDFREKACELQEAKYRLEHHMDYECDDDEEE